MARLDPTGVSRILSYIKNWVTTALGGKANSSHSHTKSQITDFPTIPSNTSQLTNDSGYITSSGSCNYANSTGYVQGNNNSTNAANALLRSGSGRTDSSPEGDTWIFLDELGGASAPWGFKHNQAANTIGFYGAGTETSSINLSNGHFSGSCNYANSAGSAGSATTAETVSTSATDGSTKDLVYAYMAANDYCHIRCGGTSDAGYLEIATGDNGNEPIYVKQYDWEGNSRTLTLLDGSGNTQFPGTVSAPTFSGNLNGSCSGTAGGVAWDNVSGKPSAFTPYFANGTWYAVGDDAAIGDHNVGGGLGVKALNSTTTRIDLCYKDDASNYKSITYDGTTLYMNGNCNYANSAGNSDTLDGYHEYSFLRSREATDASGEGTLWAQIGIKNYHNALPDGLNDVYNWGEVVSLAGICCRFDIYCSHMSSAGNGLYYRSGWNDDKMAWRRLIDDGNTGNISISGYQVYVG